MSSKNLHARQCPKPFPQDELRLVYDDRACPSTLEDFTQRTNDEKTTVTVTSILRYIALHQGVNSPALARFFVKTLKTIGRFTTELRYRDFIEFRGTLNKGGYFLKPSGLHFLKNPETGEPFSPTRMTADLVYAFILENPGTNHFAIAAHFQRTIKSATRHTQNLRQKGKIFFQGSPRDGGFHATQ